MNAYGMQSGGSGMPPVPQNIFATYSSSSATSTGKLLAQQRLASLLYPGEQSLSKFGWADRVRCVDRYASTCLCVVEVPHLLPEATS